FVRGFTNVEKRIRLGKKVASIVYSRQIYRQLLEFIHTIDHTGSRRDYEQFLNIHLPPSPMLRLAYPNIRHKDQIRKDWLDHYQVKKTWFTPIMKPNLQEMSLRFYSKRYLLYAYSRFKQIFSIFQYPYPVQAMVCNNRKSLFFYFANFLLNQPFTKRSTSFVLFDLVFVNLQEFDIA